MNRMLTSIKLNRKIRREYQKSSKVQQRAFHDVEIEASDYQGLMSYKSTNTIYILGSGASVLKLSTSKWSEVSTADSFGLNFWTIHPHIPTYYTFELPRVPVMRDLMLHNYRNRLDDYKNTAVMLKAEASYDRGLVMGLSKSSQMKDGNLTIPAYYTVQDESQLVYLLKNYKKIQSKFRLAERGVFFRKRASVIFAAMLAYDLGYKNIVFCGIDGYAGSGYFYHDASGCSIVTGALSPASSGQPDGAVHKTMSTEHNSLNVDYCLSLMSQYLFDDNGVRMWVGTEHSMLSKWMPSWKWQS